MSNKLLELLKIESAEIQQSFKKASVEGEGTPQEVADRREAIVINKFLAKYFPFPYRIVKGNIIDSYERRSNSIDCIVINPSHPYTIDSGNDRASIIFADGVDYAIEVKPNLVDKGEIERSLEQIRSVKKLRRKRTGLIYPKKHSAEQIENAKTIPTFIFSDKTYADIKLLITYIVEYYISNNVPLSEQFDFIVINNRTMLFNSKRNSYYYLNEMDGILFTQTNENTLALFLILLNKLTKSQPDISPSVINFYISDKDFEIKFQYFPDLNERLNNHYKSLI